MSSPYDNSSRRRGAWSHWVPLVVTVTVATVGIAAWVWSQRGDEDPEDPEPYHQDLDYENADYGDNPAYGASGDQLSNAPPPSFGGGDLRPGETGYGTTHIPQPPSEVNSGWAGMSGALLRTPSPQQFFDSARKTVAAGVTAAGAVVGNALSSIREEDKTAYADHETWSEEADAKKERPAGASQAREPHKRRKTVAIVVTADGHSGDLDSDDFHEHAVRTPNHPYIFERGPLTQAQSILSHITRQNDFSKIKLFILIYAPSLKDASLDASNNLPPPSLSSSFSNIEHNQAQTPGEEAKSPL